MNAHEQIKRYCYACCLRQAAKQHYSFENNKRETGLFINVRIVSDVPEQVVKMGSATVKDLQKNGLMVAGFKHFPGDGLDD